MDLSQDKSTQYCISQKKKSPFFNDVVQRFINVLIPNAKNVFCLGNTQPKVQDTPEGVACRSLSYRTCVADIFKIYLGKVFGCDGRLLRTASVTSSSLANSPRNASSYWSKHEVMRWSQVQAILWENFKFQLAEYFVSSCGMRTLFIWEQSNTFIRKTVFNIRAYTVI